MKRILISLCIILSATISFAQDELSLNFKEYSYTQLFEMIQNEKDSIFELKNALIRFNPQTDSLFVLNPNIQPSEKEIKLTINKSILLDNVHFESKTDGVFDTNNVITTWIYSGVIQSIQFNKGVVIKNSVGVEFNNCIFKQNFSFNTRKTISQVSDYFFNKVQINYEVKIAKSDIYGRISLTYTGSQLGYSLSGRISFNNNSVYLPKKQDYLTRVSLFGRNINYMSMRNNTFYNSGLISFNDIENSTRRINNNNFGDALFLFNLSASKGFNNFSFTDNVFSKPLEINIDKLSPKYIINYKQFKNLIVTREGVNFVKTELESESENNYWNNNMRLVRDSLLTIYKSKKTTNIAAYNEEMALKGLFHQHYKSRFDNKNANLVYIEMKDLETSRLKYEYSINKSFESFFTWKVNQFLKVFSAYGTKPAKSIIFSIYVILAFSLIYLFFPNSWDKHGKNRIVDRYNFFFKYMKRKAGIHEVYLEEQKEELMSYDQFKENITTSKQNVPRFFTATALLLYKWAISGSKLSAAVLKRIDIMKGTWSELPQHKRFWKSVLLIGAFTVAVCYDVLIKMLNALMLSINTFTTLGFGEIPIKGLPRYLAIIQGFIGWFMLTIFSVSLISQLLN